MENTNSIKENDQDQSNSDAIPSKLDKESETELKKEDKTEQSEEPHSSTQGNNQQELEFSKLKRKHKYSEYYKFEKLIGQGAFGQVYKALDVQSGDYIAVKVIKRKSLNQNDVHLLRQEAEILKTMSHENIVQFKHIREIGGRIFLGMELMQGGQLTQLIAERKNKNQKFTDEEASKIMKSILQAAAYIHSIGIVHRDLKPDNILISDLNDLSSVKLADFGLSAKYDHVSFTTLDQHCGTLIFMAPEVALKKEYSKSVDIWSIGIIMYMLLTGGSHPLFTSKDNAETYKDALQHPWITRINKTLIPLTLPDKMNHLELEVKLKTKMSVIFFASLVKIKSEEKLKPSKTEHDPEMQNYKRLVILELTTVQLDKVTKKIDKWHEEQRTNNKEWFKRDDEYVELDRSPTRFSSSGDEEEDEKEKDQNINEPNSPLKPKHHKNPKSNPQSFKLSLLEADPNKKELGPSTNLNAEEEAEFMSFLMDKDNQKNNKGLNHPRRRSIKKNSLAASPPVKREKDIVRKKISSKANQIQTNGFEQNQNSQGVSGTTTQTSNQAQPLSFNNQSPDVREAANKLVHNTSFGSYNDQHNQANSQLKNTTQNAYYSSVKHNSAKLSSNTVDENFKMQMINSERPAFNIGAQNAYPGNSTSYLSQQQQKKVNCSQISGGVDMSAYEVTGPPDQNGYLQNKRGLKSYRVGTTQQPNAQDQTQPNKKPINKKQSLPFQQQTTHQINLNDILKKNEAYDQKFLFKKNFIPKQKPVMMINQMNNQYTSQVSNLPSTQTGYQGQQNYKKQKSKKSKSNQHFSNSNSSAPSKPKNSEGNTLNYFTTLNNEFDDRRQNEMQQVALKFWNMNQSEVLNNLALGQVNSKNSQSDLPVIVNKSKGPEMANQPNIQNLQKSKTGKGFDSKFKVSQTTNFFSGSTGAIREEDGQLGDIRPTTQGLQQIQNSQLQNRNLFSIYEQQMMALSQLDNENLTSALSNPFGSPHIQKNKPNKIKPIDRVDQMSMINSRVFNIEELSQNFNAREFINKSFDTAGHLGIVSAGVSIPNDPFNQIVPQLQNLDAQNQQQLYNLYQHKRHKSMNYKSKNQALNNSTSNNGQNPYYNRNPLASQGFPESLGLYSAGITAQQFMQNQQNPKNLPNGIQGQQVILTDNFVNGNTNQIIKYKNKIIIRQ